MTKLKAVERINYIMNLLSPSTNTPKVAMRHSSDATIYYLKTKPEDTAPTGYWYDIWGGTYDNLTHTDVRIWFKRYLVDVLHIGSLLTTDYSMATDGDFIYMHMPLTPTDYSNYEARILGERSSIMGYSSAPRAEGVTDDLFEGENGVMHRYPTRLKAPSFRQKLANGTGQLVQNSFDISFENSDGIADHLDIAAAYVKIGRASGALARIEDFKTIGEGSIEDVKIKKDTASMKLAGVLRNMDAPVCREYNTSDFLHLKDTYVDKPIPVGWGYLKKIRLRRINTVRYMKDGKDHPDGETERNGISFRPAEYHAIDNDYIDQVEAILDSDGNNLGAFTVNHMGVILPRQTRKKKVEKEFNSAGEEVDKLDKDGNTIPLTKKGTGDDHYEWENTTAKPTYVNIRCKSLRLGEIIWRELERAAVPFTDSVWDTTEARSYNVKAPLVNLMFSGKTVKSLVSALLKNDLAYLIQKADGRVSLRRVMDDFSEWECPNWSLLDYPDKNYSDKKLYCSSIVTEYEPVNKKPTKTYRDRSNSNAIVGKYRKIHELDFESMTGYASAKEVSDDRYAYYGKRRERFAVRVAVDLSEVSLLDTVNMRIEVNGRLISNNTVWRVLEIDNAKDYMLLEERN